MSEPETSLESIRYRVPTTLWLLLGTALLFTLSGSTSLWALPTSFTATVILLNIFTIERTWTRRQLTLMSLLMLVGFASRPNPNQLDALLEDENLPGLYTRLSDRIALGGSPTLFGRTVVEGHPHVFYATTENAEAASLQIGASETNGTPLGQGLFRFAVQNPQGLPEGFGRTQANLKVDGITHPQTLRFHPALAHPRWFCSNPSQTQSAALSEETDEAFIIIEDAELTTIGVGNAPTDCVLGAQLFVSHRYSTKVGIYDPSTGKAAGHIDVGSSQVRLARSIDGTLAAALVGSRDGIQLINGTTHALGEFIALPSPPDWIAFGPTSDTLLVSSRHNQRLYRLYKTPEGWQRDERYLGRPVVTITRSQSGTHIYIALTGLSEDGKPLTGNHFIQDQILAIDTTTLDITSKLITTRRATRPLYEGDYLKWTQGVSPMGISVLNDERLLLVFAGSTEVWRVRADLSDPVDVLDINLDASPAPHGVVAFAGGGWAISSPLEGSLSFFDKTDTHIKTLNLAPASGVLSKTQPLAHQRRLGEQTFYEATRSGRSCQSCHTHADSDYTQHNIGDADLMPAILSARGVAHTSPYLRGGDYNQAAHLIEVTEGTFGGYIFEQHHRAEALEDYVMSLPGSVPSWLVNSAPPAAERVRAGYQAFNKARCTLCHTPPAFTNLSQHPAASLFDDFPNPTRTLDTPSLLGISMSAPYLYDGRAETIEDVLDEHNQPKRHGDIGALSKSERQDLLYFLETL